MDKNCRVSKTLLDTETLHASSVVANGSMNRERQLRGVNSYQRDLGLDVLAWVTKRPLVHPIIWTDLCCGTGRALIAAASELIRLPHVETIRIVGVDLVEHFDSNPFPERLTFLQRDVESWKSAQPCRLITCVHGLHYVGDKLAAIARAVGCLAEGGLFIAHLDLANFRFADGRPARRTIAAQLRRNGLEYDPRRRLVKCIGPRRMDWRLGYLGADDGAGPNYTGQPAVDSYYAGNA